MVAVVCGLGEQQYLRGFKAEWEKGGGFVDYEGLVLLGGLDEAGEDYRVVLREEEAGVGCEVSVGEIEGSGVGTDDLPSGVELL